jgi:hypothetical protein
LRASNTSPLRQKRHAGNGSSINLHRAKSLCNFETRYISNLAISRILECDVLIGILRSRFQAAASLADQTAVMEMDAGLCLTQRRRNLLESFHASRQAHPTEPRPLVFRLGPFPSIRGIAQRYEIPDSERPLEPVVPS